MFSGLTYRKKNQWLIIGSLSFLLLCYFLSLRITKESISHNFELQGSVEVSRNAPQLIREYEEELAKTEQIFGNNSNDEFIFQDQLLAVVTPFCEQNHLVLRSFPAPHKMESGGFEVQTTVFAVEGTFSNLLRLVYELEQKNKVGRIAAVKFVSQENHRTKELRLRVEIFVQNFKKEKN